MNGIHIFQKPSYNILDFFLWNQNPLVLNYYFLQKIYFLSIISRLKPVARPADKIMSKNALKDV